MTIQPTATDVLIHGKINAEMDRKLVRMMDYFGAGERFPGVRCIILYAYRQLFGEDQQKIPLVNSDMNNPAAYAGWPPATHTIVQPPVQTEPPVQIDVTASQAREGIDLRERIGPSPEMVQQAQEKLDKANAGVTEFDHSEKPAKKAPRTKFRVERTKVVKKAGKRGTK